MVSKLSPILIRLLLTHYLPYYPAFPWGLRLPDYLGRCLGPALCPLFPSTGRFALVATSQFSVVSAHLSVLLFLFIFLIYHTVE